MIYHRYVIFIAFDIERYDCNCTLNQHIAYQLSNTEHPSYILCFKTKCVLATCYEDENEPGIFSINCWRRRACLEADCMTVYTENKILKILKIYNKLRLILHSDIIQHVIYLLVRKIYI
jgi:hypothetical protein